MVTGINNDAPANSKILKKEILKFLENSDFWKNLVDLEAVHYPYCVAFNILQQG
jgi:hypothetical protein